MKQLWRHGLAYWLVGSAILIPVLACTSDPTNSAQSPIRPSFDREAQRCNGNWEGTAENPNDDFEEEIFGAISGGSFESAALLSRDTETGSNQPSRDSTVEVNTGTCLASPYNGHNNHGAEWGFYGIGSFANNCNYPTDTEHHRPPGGAFGNNQENHCAKAGRFRVEFRTAGKMLGDPPDFVLPVDFIQYTGPFRVEKVDALSLLTPSTDVILDYTTTAGTNPTAYVSISAALPADLTTAAWVDAPVSGGKAQVPANFTLRTSSGQSTSPNCTDPSTMVRYFWDWPSTSGPTGFVNVRECGGGGQPLVRVKSYSQGEHTILAQVVAPWQHSSLPFSEGAVNYGDTAAVTVNVYAPLTVTDIITTPGIVVKNQSASFSTAGQAGSGGLTYRWVWSATDSTAWTSSTSVPKTFTTSGVKSVTVRKKDSNGYVFSYTEQITVYDPLVPIIYTNYSGGTQPKKNQTCWYYGGSTGGSGGVTFGWYRRNNGSGTWTLLGTTTDISTAVGTTGFDLRLDATDGIQSTSTSITVTPPGSGGATCIL